MEIRDLNYYQNLLQNINDKYKENILEDQNYSYTVAGEVTPITGNEIIKGVDPIKGYNHITAADVNYSNISELSQFQNTFLSTSKANLIETNKQLNEFMINIFGVPAGDGVRDMINNLNYNPNSEMLKYLGEESPEVKANLAKLNLEYNQNQISIAIFNKEQSFINGLNAEATFSKLGAAEKAIFLDVLNSYDELVTNYESEVQNSGMRHAHGNLLDDGMIGDVFSKTNVAAMKLNKAKDMLKMLSGGMKADDLQVYEKTYDYEIEFNEKLASAVKEHGIGSPQANLLSAQAEASRRTRLYVESVRTMQTSTNALDIAVVNQWKSDGYDPLDTNIINDMQADIINQSSIAGIQTLYKGDQSKYALAMDSVTSMKEKALKLTNVNRDGAVSTTEIAALLVDAAANGNKVDGINLDVIKAALAANGVTSTQVTKVETLIDQIDTNNDGQMSFDESLARFTSFNKSQGYAAFNDMMNILAATKVDQTTNPSAFTTIGKESFFTGDYSTQDKAILSTFLASNGRYVHTTEEKFEALDAFHDNAGNTVQQRSDWRDYAYANWAQSESAGDVWQDTSLAWSFKNGTNVSGFLKQMQEMTSSRTQLMMDILEYGNATKGSEWWNDMSLSYFEVIRDESNVLLVGQRGGTQQDGRLMDMIGEALQITYADYGNYHTGINVDIDGIKDNVSGADKVELKYFADNVKSFGTTDIQYDANLVNQSLQQYYAMWGLRAGLYSNINKISEPEAKLIENKFGALMDVGDQMEAYLLQNKTLGKGAKETDQYRALEEQWFNNYDLINGIIRGDTSIDKAVTALGGIKADGSISQTKVEDVVKNLQSAIINATDDTALDFNRDGNVDSADYDALRMVIGDRRNESAFDALMTQDSLNLSKLGMYSSLAKNTTNVNANNKAIYSQLENYYADQSEVNNYIATNTASSSFASAAEQQRFTELANQLDELNEAVEFNLRDKLFKNTPATINAELKAKADKASNEMVLLSLGLSKDDSAAVAANFTPGFKITEALDKNVETVLQLMAELKKDNKIDLKQLITVSKLLIEDEEYITELAQFKKLGEYIAIGANTNEIKTYIKLAGNNAPQESLDLLDDYIRNGTDIPLTDAEENKFLDYLSNETNTDIAKTYLSLITGNDANKAGKLAALEALAANNATDKLDDTQEDVFLNYLTSEGNINIAQTYAGIINGNETDTVKTAKLASLAAFALANDNGAISSSQENKFLDYLKSSSAGVAKTYLALIKNSASPEKFALLDKLAKGEYSLSETQENTFFDFLTKFQNAKLAETYAGIIEQGGNQSSITYLEDYAKGDLDIALSINQENQMLDYLGGSENSNIAKSYVNFIQASATEDDLKILNDIYQKSNNIKQPIKPEDLTFFRTLENLANEYKVRINPTQFLEYLDNANFDDINQMVAKIATHVGTNNDNSKTLNGTNLSKDLLRVMIDPVRYDLSTTYKGEATPIFKDILELQLKALRELDQNDPKVIQSIKYASDRLASINADLNPVTGSLNSTERRLYSIFTNAFPEGQTPTQAQSLAAVELITTGGNFGSNSAFLTNYGRFVSSGDNTSANNLVEIANYFGSKPEYAASIRTFTDTDLDTKTISTAKEILNLTKMLDTQNSPDLTGVLLTANRNFLIDTMLNKKDNIFDPATENDLTKSFFQSLKEIFSEKPDSIDNKTYSDFARNAISKFSNDLKSNGIVNRNSFTTVLVKDISKGSLGIYGNDGIAQMQINVFEGMLSFYQSLIQQENAKSEPNTSKIAQWQSQINANQSAINALRSTL
jgi:hypothetical protein